MRATEPTISSGLIRGLASSAIFLTVFGGLWALGGLLILGARYWLLGAFALLCLIGLFSGAARLMRAARALPDSAYTPPVKSRAFRLGVLFEAVAIPVSSTILARIHRPLYIMPAIAVVVGLHFFMIWPAFKSRRYLVTGFSLCLLPVLTILLLPPTMQTAKGPVSAWGVVTAFACALILWLSALVGLLDAFGRLRSDGATRQFE